MSNRDEISIGLGYILQYRGMVACNLALLLVTSVVEALGLGILIPILQSMEGSLRDDLFTVYASKLCALVGLAPSFPNLMLVFLALLLTKYLLMGWQQHVARVLSATVTCDLRERAFDNLMALPLGYYYRHKIGDLIATLYTSSNNAGAVVELVMTVAMAAILCLVYISLNVLISPPMTAVAVSLALISYFLIIPRFRVGFIQGSEEKDITDNLSSFVLDKLGGIKVVKAFYNEKIHQEKFLELARAFRRIQIRIQDNRILASLFLEPFVSILVFGLVLVGINKFHLSAMALIAFIYIFSRIIPKVKDINNSYLIINNLLPHFAKINELIQSRDKTYLPVGTRRLPGFSREIAFQGVWFKYPETRAYSLKDVRLTIEKDQTTALVGASGGGKTTLVDLLLRHHDPQEGVIRVDGVDLKEIHPGDWHRLVSIVDQDAYLFNDTIANNIRYGKLDASLEEVIQAAWLANAHHFIEDLPERYDTLVGERGMKLSGGQKQRLALARALIRNPEILILDEATSNLDTESERFIQEAIENWGRSKTLVIIAHRLSTIANCHKIIVIEDGRVVEQGEPTQLLGLKNSYYRKYHSLQFL
jgi:subfamily B ATP-binding cassette protein MsbA